MAVSGLPDACENHAKCIAKLALDIMDMAKNVTMGGEPVVSTWIHFMEISEDLWDLFCRESQSEFILGKLWRELLETGCLDTVSAFKFNWHIFDFDAKVSFQVHFKDVLILSKFPLDTGLFGNTVNITSRTETTGVPGTISVSEETYKWVVHLIIEIKDINFIKPQKNRDLKPL